MVSAGSLSYIEGSQHIVFNRLVRAVLHQRHMLVRCCMVHDLRPVRFEDILDPLLVPHRSDQYFQIKVRIVLLQLQLYLIGIVLIDIDDDQLLRVMQGDLPADLASDGAAPAGHKDDLAADVSVDLFHMQVHRLPSQQVFDTDVPEHGDVDLLVDHLVDARQHLDLACGILADFQQFPPLLIFQGRNGDDDLFDIVLLRHIRDGLFASHDGDSLQIRADLLPVIVNDAGHLAVQVLAVFHLAHEHIAGCARAHHHGHHRLCLPDHLVVAVRDPQEPVGKPRRDHADRVQQDIDENIAPRHRIPEQLHPAELYERGKHDRHDGVFQLFQSREPPQAGIQMAERVDKDCAHHIDPHVFAHRIPEYRINTL